MLKIKDNVDLKELEKYGFIIDSYFSIIHRPIYDDYIEQFEKMEYLVIHPKTKVILKGKQCCIIDFKGNTICGYYIKTNKIKRYVTDLIQADLVEKVSD